MNSSERIDNLLNGKPVDRKPVVPLIMRYAAKLIGKPYSEYCRDYRVLVSADMKSWEILQYDMLSPISDAFREAYDFGEKVEFPYDGIPYCKDFLIKEYSDINKIKIPEPRSSERMLDRIKAVELFKKEVGDEVPILGWIEGAFAEACDLRGVQTTMMDVYDNPQFLFELLEIITKVEIEFAKEQIKAGATFIGIGESVGSLVSAKTYREFALPYMKRIINEIHKMKAKARLHICGNITHILELIPETDVDIVDLDWMVSIKEAREKFGPDICITGNFDPVAVLLEGTPDDIKRHIEEEEKDGGDKYMICPGCEVPPDTPLENMLAFCPGRQ